MHENDPCTAKIHKKKTEQMNYIKYTVAYNAN